MSLNVENLCSQSIFEHVVTASCAGLPALFFDVSREQITHAWVSCWQVDSLRSMDETACRAVNARCKIDSLLTEPGPVTQELGAPRWI